jgi:hypothetical protein
MVRPVLHIILHIAVPGVVARLGWREQLWRSWVIMVATLIIDLDHLLANPIYDANRCSIGVHPLHGGWAMIGYALLVVPKRTRLIGVGLVIHMALDAIDCLFM